ncbi:hypothetical protein HBH82_016540 [Parastagonospora nodorum]|nr:hypothetical protein HBH82_016540 [Parastagonospora nodorum]KAH4713430.1 hypothetical protein HBH67_004550 [Parastagonospora nodorum]KAH4728554.1 hypothetical protein HBH78_018510 [Parastagonospora nodorum]KAH4792844.1 hypothetical protein HBH62_019740 [Parastagonospora nodorum]KAH4830716.1 hypothetical protein HBH63_032450 [Parastagonospora nodorum]
MVRLHKGDKIGGRGRMGLSWPRDGFCGLGIYRFKQIYLDFALELGDVRPLVCLKLRDAGVSLARCSHFN